MWQKFFFPFLILTIIPKFAKASPMISSVTFSGNPPTKAVLHPGGLSLVVGGGASVTKQNPVSKRLLKNCTIMQDK